MSELCFTSNDKILEKGFNWAKEQALYYVKENNIVGKWYEASLPNRKSFCIRDVAHHANGAHFLGLEDYTKNMLYKFCENISESKDFCTYWEIDENNQPTAVDYESDNDFWYNLPANFDIVDCCYRMFMLTGDYDYINNETFINFYEKTFNEYVKAWDINDDGIVEGLTEYGRRGIASYYEEKYSDTILVGCDLLCIMYAGYKSYVEILKLQNASEEKINKYSDLSNTLKKMLNSNWWNDELKNYRFGKNQKGEFFSESLKNYHVVYMALYNKIPDNEEKAKHMLIKMINSQNINVESLSHFSEIFYSYNDCINGYNFLEKITNETLQRREYPEVSYGAISSIVSGLMGVTSDARENKLFIVNRLLYQGQHCKLSNLNILNTKLNITHNGTCETIVENQSDKRISIKISFIGYYTNIICNGQIVKHNYENDLVNNYLTYVDVTLDENVILKIVANN